MDNAENPAHQNSSVKGADNHRQLTPIGPAAWLRQPTTSSTRHDLLPISWLPLTTSHRHVRTPGQRHEWSFLLEPRGTTQDAVTA
jgi:hypothetical protein